MPKYNRAQGAGKKMAHTWQTTKQNVYDQYFINQQAKALLCFAWAEQRR